MKESEQLRSRYLQPVNQLIAQGKLDEAIALCKEADKEYPDDARVLRLLGSAHRKRGDSEAAILTFSRLFGLDLQQPFRIYLTYAQLLRECERFSEAIAVFQQALHYYPDEVDAYRLLAVVQEKVGNFNDAISSYRKTVELQPDKPIWVYLNLGRLLTDQERFDEVVALYQQALTYFPQNVDLARNLAVAQTQQGNLEAAIVSYQKLVELQPDSPAWVYFTLGQLLSDQERLDAAIRLYQQALGYYADHADFYQTLAVLYSKQGNAAAAIANYSKSIELQPNSPAWVYQSLGQLLIEQERFDQAIQLYQAAIVRFPGNVSFYAPLGLAQKQAGDLQGAIQHYRQTLELEPQQPIWLHLTLGQLLVEQHGFSEAIQVYQRAIQQYPDQLEAYRLLGVAQERAGKLEAAIATYREVLEREPDGAAWVYLALGNLLTEQNRLDEAIELYQQAITVHPDHTEIHRLLAGVYRRNDDPEAEIASYRKLLTLQPKQPFWIYSTLGYLLSQQGELEQAIECYQAAFKANSERINSYFLQRAEAFLAEGDLQQATIAYQQAIFLSSEWENEASTASEPVLAARSASEIPRVCIITPVFNGAQFIDDTIYSIVTQSGNFVIRYHIQDGQSTDGTLEKLEAWQQRLADGNFPILCRGIEFTFASQPDQGMYDGLNQAVAALDLQPNDYMTWINADDRFVPGALATIVEIFNAFAQIHWLGGRTALINQEGLTTHLGTPVPFGRRAIRAGLHDGRKLPFIMQEGTFWRGWLWQTVEGVNPSLQLAGDYDLWKRFAEHAHYILVDSVLANHRRRCGQLSSAMDRYYQEVERTLGKEGSVCYEETWQAFNQLSQLEQLRDEFSGRILQYDRTLQCWHYSRFPYAAHLSPSLVVSSLGERQAVRASFGQGFSMMEGANPVKNLPAGVRWTTERTNHLTFETDQPGRYEIALACQTFHEVSIALWQDDQLIFTQDLPVTNHDCVCKVTATALLVEAVNPIELRVTFRQTNRSARIAIISCEAVMVQSVEAVVLPKSA